jgi:hypothetical protein
MLQLILTLKLAWSGEFVGDFRDRLARRLIQEPVELAAGRIEGALLFL